MMKKIVISTIAVIGLLIFIVNLVNNFEKPKVFYASFYPDKYFYKDTLIPISIANPSTSGPNKTYYRFMGYCQSDSTKSGVEISFSRVENENSYFDRKKIPIWRNKITKTVLYRYNENIYPKPFSFKMLDYWLGTIMSILFLPCFIYLIYIKKSKK